MPTEHQPGAPAPNLGEFEELNVFGRPTGRTVVMAKDARFPASARGFTWRPLSQRSPAELQARAAEYRGMAATARTAPVRSSLLKLAGRYEALAIRQEARKAEA